MVIVPYLNRRTRLQTIFSRLSRRPGNNSCNSKPRREGNPTPKKRHPTPRATLQTVSADVQDYTQAYRRVLAGNPIIRVTGEQRRGDGHKEGINPGVRADWSTYGSHSKSSDYQLIYGRADGIPSFLVSVVVRERKTFPIRL